MKNNKSQSALEFISIIVALVFLFALLFVSINEKLSDKIKENNNIEIKEIAYNVQDEINLAFKSSDGYVRHFKIPNDINGKNFSISITANMIYVKSYDEKSAIAVPIPKISGNVVKGDNLIKKYNGTVYLNL
ncbi:MAG: hypothetical protein QXW97_04240 [Candidatus Pacearchaeota archaeon]